MTTLLREILPLLPVLHLRGSHRQTRDTQDGKVQERPSLPDAFDKVQDMPQGLHPEAEQEDGCREIWMAVGEEGRGKTMAVQGQKAWTDEMEIRGKRHVGEVEVLQACAVAAEEALDLRLRLGPSISMRRGD